MHTLSLDGPPHVPDAGSDVDTDPFSETGASSSTGGCTGASEDTQVAGTTPTSTDRPHDAEHALESSSESDGSLPPVPAVNNATGPEAATADAPLPKRVSAWITRVENSIGRTGDAADTTPPSPTPAPAAQPPHSPDTVSAPGAAPLVRRQRRRHRAHHAVQPSMSPDGSTTRLRRASEKLAAQPSARMQTFLGRLSGERARSARPPREAAVWVLGTAYGMDSESRSEVSSAASTRDEEVTASAPAASPPSSTSGWSASSASARSVPWSAPMRAAAASRRRRAWRTEAERELASLVWCTYRSHFPPIARDGQIAADEEATAASVSAATEQLCAAPGTERRGSDGESAKAAPAPSLAQVLLRPGDVLPSSEAIHAWLLQQLEGRGWQLPGVLHQLPVATGTQRTAREPASPGEVASSLRQVLNTVERDVRETLQRRFASVLPAGAWRDSLLLRMGEYAGLPALWNQVSALYQAASCIATHGGLTTDASWGCMLRTAQSMLANALLRVHLGRGWRLPEREPETPEEQRQQATYVRVLSWFFDDPSAECPFSIHRLVGEGRRCGMEVGSWFGPSTAAAVIKQLVGAHPESRMAVVFSNDGEVSIEDVRRAARGLEPRTAEEADDAGSHPAPGTGTPDAAADDSSSGVAAPPSDGTATPHAAQPYPRPVLILVAQRLGIDAVPAQYHAALKDTFTLPQSVGVAGGRPGSSLYFVGCQGDQLLYLDPHTCRPTIPFRHPPPSLLEERSDAPGMQERDSLLTSWYCHAYSPRELATFHAEEAESMTVSRMDPSMLFGFLCQSDTDLEALRERIEEHEPPLFSIVGKRRARPRVTRQNTAESQSSGEPRDSDWEFAEYSEASAAA